MFGGLQFPFTSAYVYTANNDLLLDYVFHGGTLANAVAWTTTSLRTYYLDGFYWTTAVTYGRNVYKTAPGTCNDSAWTHTTAAQSSIQVGLYGKLYPPTSTPPNAQGTAQAQIFGSATAPNAAIIKAFSLQGLNPQGVGVPIGANCNNLMIDLSGFVVYMTFTTDASGNHNPWTYAKIGNLATLRKSPNIAIWCQGAWADSKTGAFSLTSCERCSPNWNYALLEDASLIPNKQTVYTSSNTSTTGSGPYNYYYMNPITRYN